MDFELSDELKLLKETARRFTNETQRAKYLEPALCGEWTASYVVTEPDAGSDTGHSS